MIDVSERLKQIRKERKLTIQEVCDGADIAVRTYQNYEYGKREISVEALFKLAQFYNVTTDYLLGREPADKQPNPITQLTNEEMEQRLLKAYFSLPDKLRNDFLKGMAEQLGMEREVAQNGIIQHLVTTIIQKHLNRASAGFGYDLSNDDEWVDIEVIRDRNSELADFAVQIEGNSMLPEYKDGDVVYIVKDPDVPVGKVGLFIQNGKGYIKERGEKYLISTNSDFPHIYPEDGEIVCIGRVIGIAEFPQ